MSTLIEALCAAQERRLGEYETALAAELDAAQNSGIHKEALEEETVRARVRARDSLVASDPRMTEASLKDRIPLAMLEDATLTEAKRTLARSEALAADKACLARVARRRLDAVDRQMELWANGPREPATSVARGT